MNISNVFPLKMTKKNIIWIFIFTLACNFQDVTAKHLLDCHEKWSYMPCFLVLANYLNLSSHFDFHLLWIPERTVSYLTHHCRLWKNKICSFDCLFLSLQITGKKFIYNARYNMPMTSYCEKLIYWYLWDKYYVWYQTLFMISLLLILNK